MFEVIDQNNEDYAAVVSAMAASTERTDYNLICTRYNKLAVGAILHFPFPKRKATSLKNQLERRGVSPGTDVATKVIQLEDDSPDTHAFLRKLTAAEATMSESKVGRKPGSKKAPAEKAEKTAAKKK